MLGGVAELFGRPSPSPKISDFENPLDSDSACLFVYAFIFYALKTSTFHKKIPKFQFFLSLNPIIPFINHMHRYLLSLKRHKYFID
jgi:hypothetical protein